MIYLVILAGGSGTRLWPLSREKFPKQFLKIGSSDSLVRETVLRILPLVSWDRVLMVCGHLHHAEMQQQLPELKEEQFLLEPCAKNTAAAIALAAEVIKRKDPNGVLIVLPADHKIPENDLEKFRNTLSEACRFAEEGKGLMTLGIQPSYPSTGYGYILKGKWIKSEPQKIFKVDRFQEKPDSKTAVFYFKSGEYFWNSGMFVWKVSDYLEAYHRFLPEDAKLLSQLPSERNSPHWSETLEKIYPKLTSISVDYAILEKSDSVYVIESEFEWDDVGSLNSLARYYPQDSDQNATEGNVVTVDSNNNLILSDQGIVACLGIENLIVIQNKNSILILPKDRAEEVKKVLEKMKKEKNEEYL